MGMRMWMRRGEGRGKELEIGMWDVGWVMTMSDVDRNKEA